MVGIIHRAVVLFDIRHEVVDEVLAEHVTAKACLGLTACGLRFSGQQLRGVAIRQHDNHLLSLLVSQQIVENVIHTAHLVIYLLGICRTTDEIEHGILLLEVLHIRRWQIDNSLIGGTKALGVIVDILQTSVRHIFDIVRQCAVARNLQKAVLETFVGEVLVVLRVHHAHSINDEAIGIHVRGSRSQRRSPHARLFVAGHGVTACKLHIDLHILGLIVLVEECHCSILIATDGFRSLLLSPATNARQHSKSCQ